MMHRILLTVAGVGILGVSLGCRGPGSGTRRPDGAAGVPAGGPQAVTAPADVEAAVAAERGDELGRLAGLCRQLDGLMSQEPIPLTSVEALGWTVSGRARGLCARYYHAKRPRGDAKLEDLVAAESSDYEFAQAPPEIRDLDRVAICAEHLATAASIRDEAGARKAHDGLRKAAARCLRGQSSAAAPR